ncbi:helicase associated domain-containing protein [Streptomyces sp. NPDC102406]|uniref:helicase associated domain-containing protein n=1 Tax=Streptomyces sp. NPDC102406 TaxID=3366171 RepID=UPI003806B9B0
MPGTGLVTRWQERREGDRCRAAQREPSATEHAGIALEDTLSLNVPGIEPAPENEQPVKRTQEHKWLLNLAAARQFHAREGHLNIPRKHIEELPLELAGPAATGRETTPEGTVLVDLGTWTANVRRRASKLTDERRASLDELGTRW